MSDNQSHDAEVLSPAHLDRFNVQTNHRKPTREEALGRVPISFEVKGFAKFGGSDLSFLRGVSLLIHPLYSCPFPAYPVEGIRALTGGIVCHES
jgi:hypothetical protein